MSVKARITAIKRNGEAITERQSAERIHIDASNGIDSIEVIIRADGRMSIEVRNGRAITQSLDLIRGYRTLGSVVDGTVSLL